MRNSRAVLTDLVILCKIYRTYVVWQNYWIVVLPVLGWFGLFCAFFLRLTHDQVPCSSTGTAASIGLNIALATASTHAGDVFAVQTGRWITANYSITLATNLTSTSRCLS
jgi:hypothetical protein